MLEILDSSGFCEVRAGTRRRAFTERLGRLVTPRACRYRVVGALLALAGIGATGRALAGEAGLIIETGSPDALCPELASTRAAVSRRLGELIVPGGSSGFRARYTIAHALVGSPRDFVRLELYGPEGTLQLSRDLPLEGESCGTMAEVIALVLDRYFRQVLAHDRPGADEDAPASVAAPPATSAPPSPAAPEAAAPPPTLREATPTAVPSADIAPRDARSAAASAASDRLALGAFEVAFRSPNQPALGMRGMLELWPDWYAGTALHVALRAQTEGLTGGGKVSSQEASWRVDAGWGPRLGPVHTYFGPAICLGLALGSGDDLPQRESGLRATWAVGLDAGAVWVTDDGWSLGASAAVDVSVLSGRFQIDGEEVLAPERLRAWLGMSVGHAF